MKKITFAVLALMASSGSAFAATAYTGVVAGEMVDPQTVSSNYTYTVSGTQLVDRKFVKNDFDFTLSANTIIATDEDTDGRYMGVATANVRGRNIFTGNSDGGSVTNCGDPLTATDAKVAGAHAAEFATRFDATLTAASSCSTAPAPTTGG